MPEEFKLNQQAVEAAAAKQLLENALLIGAYEQIEADLVAAWIASDPRDTAGRELAWHSVIANRRHKSHLENAVSNGTVATGDLKVLFARKKIMGVL